MVQLIRRLSIASVLVCAVFGFCLVGASVASASSTITQVSGSALPDPGISDFGGTGLWVYGTGGQFPYASAASLASGFGPLQTGANAAMPTPPEWVGTGSNATCSNGSGGYSDDEWAPQVVEINGTYVMYFSACENPTLASELPNGSNHHCIGIATSSSPNGPFTAPTGWTDTPYCAPAAANGPNGTQAEAIDPAPFEYDGSWYMTYKTSPNASDGTGNHSPWEIWVDPLGTNGLDARDGGAHVSKMLFEATSGSGEGTVAEGPDIIEHDGTMWLFLSRGDYTTCGYHEEAWSASGATGGRFYNDVTSSGQTQDNGVFTTPNSDGTPYTMLENVTYDGDSLCGAAGASVTPDGDYMAFAARAALGDDRLAYVSPLYWTSDTASGEPTIVTP